MQDKKLREAFRSVVKFLNLKTIDSECYYSVGYKTSNNPTKGDCNIARMSDINDLQEQIDKLKKQRKNIRRKK